MRCTVVRTFLLIFLCLWLVGSFTSRPAAAETTVGALLVSMTVLPSCEVSANSGVLYGVAANQRPGDAATVTCPFAYPFRASLAYGAATGSVESHDEAGLVFTGARRIELSQFSGTTNRSVADGIATLTISY